MSDVMIVQKSESSRPAGRYVFFEMVCGRHKAVVGICPNYVTVVVQNAMHRAWRGLGKDFKDVAAAVANYKTPEVKTMIETAAREAATKAADQWNPRYLAYCRANGVSDPETMLERDREAYPGGCMAGFLEWSGDKISRAKREHPEWFLKGNLVEHDSYDRWLESA